MSRRNFIGHDKRQKIPCSLPRPSLKEDDGKAKVRLAGTGKYYLIDWVLEAIHPRQRPKGR